MRRQTALLVTAIALLPSVAAASTLAHDLDVSGLARVDGPVTAAIFEATEEGLTWEIRASSARLDREWCERTHVRSVEAGPVATPETAYCPPNGMKRETRTFVSPTILSASTPEGSALLATIRTTGTLVATLEGTTTISPERDPRLTQGDPSDVNQRFDQDPEWFIDETIPGDFVAISGGRADVEITGPLTLRPSWMSYTIQDAKGETTWVSGANDQTDVGLATRGTLERHVLFVEDAVLVVRSPSPVQILSTAPTLTIDGALRAADGTDLSAVGPVFGLSFADGLLAVGSPEPVSTAGQAIAARALAPLAWIGGAVALLALAAFAVLRLRSRPDEDPVALALLAMESRRWGDALPLLERAIRDAPTDAKLQIDRALCLEETGRLTEARDAYEAALRAQPFHAETHYYYARALARLRNSTAALAHLTRALSLDLRLAEMARRENAFTTFRDHPQFVGLLG